MSSPNNKQILELSKLLSRVFVEMRELSRAPERMQQCHDLADAVHNLPTEMLGIGLWDWEGTLALFNEYQLKYHGEGYPGQTDYVSWLGQVNASE